MEACKGVTKMDRNRKKGGIPDRWLDYKAVGKRLFGTRFIAFKVPLKQELNDQLPWSDVFGPWELLDSVRRDRQELGLIIDLTYTKRYYSLQDLPESLMFVKIFTAGHEVPSDETILSFKRAVRRFLRDNADNDRLIGVHCTHGLNRTGYLICRYLIDVDGMEPREAVKLFNSARGHNIERKNYLDDLHRGRRRSNDGMEECDQEPARGRAVPPEREYRPLPPRETHQSATHPQNFLLRTPLLPRPTFSEAVRAPLHDPYRYRPPRPEGHWRGPPNPSSSWSRHPPMWGQPRQQQQDRRRGPPPRYQLPRYTADWNDPTQY
ncbi:RNA/RNP complex-1-interacting phosphatase isoform X1 [Takifugu rubripes]|uniref:RNA/RNP complex-1-interacting phosphatase isoform X1 n=2 Tax=Takifugu rubripes TaxID=31033 RepID=UPI00114523BB|nr:RNA/RNP complex-1-interacting phosphatase isoform X1 [Takifugu rubripes]